MTEHLPEPPPGPPVAYVVRFRYPDGQECVYTHYNAALAAETAAQLRAAGYVDVGVEVIPPGPAGGPRR